MWCKTGTFCTLQVLQALTRATLAVAISAFIPVSVPAAGIWGWFGFTQTLLLLELLAPFFLAYGVFSTYFLVKAIQKWKEITVQLNEAFDVFASNN